MQNAIATCMIDGLNIELGPLMAEDGLRFKTKLGKIVGSALGDISTLNEDQIIDVTKFVMKRIEVDGQDMTNAWNMFFMTKDAELMKILGWAVRTWMDPVVKSLAANREGGLAAVLTEAIQKAISRITSSNSVPTTGSSLTATSPPVS